MKKIKVSVYTNSHYISPSSYYRINQYVDKMTVEPFEINQYYAQGDKLKKWYLSIARTNVIKHKFAQFICYTQQYINVLTGLFKDNFYFHPNVVIILRAMIGRKATPLICFLLNRLAQRTTILWDFDDNIFENGEIDFKVANILTKYADKIIVTSKFLRKQIPQLSDDKFIYLPTSDGDMYTYYCKEFVEQRNKRYQDELAIVWVGTAVNLPFLQKVISHIDTAAEIIQQQGKKVILEVVCNQDLQYTTRALLIKNIRWCRDVAIERMLKAHIGIMPLVENEFTKGKGGFKLIQYMSVGLPIIASDVGYNSEVIYPEMKGGYLLKDFGDWTATIVAMASDEIKLQEMGVASRKAWEERFSYETNYNTWVSLIKLSHPSPIRLC